MNVVKRLTDYYRVTRYHLYILANACGFRFAIDDIRFEKLNTAYLNSPSIFLWLFLSTIILLPCVFFSAWFKKTIKNYMQGYIVGMMTLSMCSFFYLESYIFAALVSSYSIMLNSIDFEKIEV